MHDAAVQPAHDAAQQLIRAHYDDFNARRFDALLGRFAADAQIEHTSGRVGQGPGEYAHFLDRFLDALPDARAQLQDIFPKGRGFYDVRVRATGTHTGTLVFGTWSFKPTGFDVRLPARELFQVVDGRFAFASVSFDLHDLVAQLTSVDTPSLVQHATRIHQLVEQLVQAEDSPLRKRELIDRIGRELDAARHVVRPYFR